jgi:hypothetical protein
MRQQGELYHGGDSPLPTRELRAMLTHTRRLRGQVEQAIDAGVFDHGASREIDRLLGVEHELAEMIRERDREKKASAA